MKHFLGKNETISLAAAIADVQEKKIQLKVDKNSRLQAPQPQQILKTRTKSKLKETKDILVARRMQAKREKVRSRKQRSQVDEEHQGSREGKPAITAQKKVSFL